MVMIFIFDGVTLQTSHTFVAFSLWQNTKYLIVIISIHLFSCFASKTNKKYKTSIGFTGNKFYI